MNELQTSIVSQLKEVADEYDILFSTSENNQFIYFTKVECGICDPCTMLYIMWDKRQVKICALGKIIELHLINNYVRLLCEILS